MKHFLILFVLSTSLLLNSAATHARFAVNTPTNAVWEYTIAFMSGDRYGQYYNNKAEIVASYQALLDTINPIFERDLAIRFKMMDATKTETLIQPGDYTNLGPAGDFIRSTSLVRGTDYDVIVSLYGARGGLAILNSCMTNQNIHVGFDDLNIVAEQLDMIKILMHELGHMLGASHTQSSGGRTQVTFVEVGSGASIMSYVGSNTVNLVPEKDIESFSDMYFHANSIESITQWMFKGVKTPSSAFLNSGSYTIVYPSAQSCGHSVANSKANTTDPVVNGGADYTIPTQTNFELTAQATDDSAALTYDWEQMDRLSHGAGNTQASLISDAPAFGLYDPLLSSIYRIYNPIATDHRSFPLLGTVLDNKTDKSDRHTTLARDIKFRVAVRDGQNGYGSDDLLITTVATSTPFKVTSQTACESIDPNTQTQTTVSWNVGETDLAPISCPSVDISLMILNDDESAYSEENIALGVDNNGSAVIALPNIDSKQNRIKIKCSNNIFYSINPVSFALTGDRLVTSQTPVQHNTTGAKVSGLITQDTSYPVCRAGVVSTGNNNNGGTGNGGTTPVTPVTPVNNSESSVNNTSGGGSFNPLMLAVFGLFVGFRRKMK